jgi:hypothetical protein
LFFFPFSALFLLEGRVFRDASSAAVHPAKEYAAVLRDKNTELLPG